VIRRAVITGCGVIAPGAATTAQFWRNCLDGIAPVSSLPAHWQRYAHFGSTIWAPLPPIDFTALGITRVEQMQLDKSAMLALAVAQQALDGARLARSLKNEKKNTFTVDGIDPERFAVYCGSGIGGLTSLIYNQANHVVSPMLSMLERLRPVLDGLAGPGSDEARAMLDAARQDIRMPQRFNPFIVSMTMPNAVSAQIGIKYSLFGPNMTTCCACAAGTVAIGQGFCAVRDGRADIALCGGVEFLGDEFGGIFRGFDAAHALVAAGDDPQTANRPFDKRRSGFLFAEGGAAMVVVEELDHARSRGADIIAEITAFAETFDGYSIMMMDPSADQIKRMLSDLVAQAGIGFSNIDYINAHGTGTLANDEIESGVIAELFGASPLVNSTKSLIGHTIGAGGAIETVVTALSIAGATTHACRNLEEPVRDLNFVKEVREYSIRKAITQSFAFGGHNAALLLSQCR
jgi:3-oxoacyl-[acyl-carrier-protein] synthase II